MWAIYGLWLVVAVALLLLPEPDFALVTKKTWPAAAPQGVPRTLDAVTGVALLGFRAKLAVNSK